MKSFGSQFKNDIRKRAYIYALKIIQFVKQVPRNSANRVIGDQLLRSATSIGANIIEAQAASSKKDFARFLRIALKSANETKFWLGLIKDSNQELEAKVNPLLQEAKEISNILAKSLLTLKNKK